MKKFCIYLILADAYAIICVAKKDIGVRLTQSESPGGCDSGAFFRLVVTVVPVQPFADVVAGYTRHDGNQKGYK